MANSLSCYVAKRASSLTNPTSASVFVTAENASNPAIVYLPGDSRANGRKFRITASGAVTGGTTTNVTIKIQYGTSATAGSNTDLASSGAVAVNSVSGNWFLTYEGVWDSTSSKIQGINAASQVNNTAVAAAAGTAQTSVTAANNGLGFVVNALFSASNASNVISMSDFNIELL